jgi:glycosyltransferase involved in cell wall biosynthesis
MVAATPSMIRSFNMRNLAILQDLGCDVEVATNTESTGEMSREAYDEFRAALAAINVPCHHIAFERGAGSLQGARDVVRSLRELQRARRFDILHTHQPAASALSRFALRGRVRRILYTAHGFHFMKGGPRRNWLIYYPLERSLSRFTDVLLTVNEEDESLARRQMHATKVVRIPGVGVDCSRFSTPSPTTFAEAVRSDLGLGSDDHLLLSVGELNGNKNHATVIRAVSLLRMKNLHYAICGTGSERGHLLGLAGQLGIARQIHLQGFQSDIVPYLAAADIAISVSLREGLGVFGLEAMASGLPLVGSAVRGIQDYMDAGRSGYLVPNPLEPEQVAKGIKAILNSAAHDRAEIEVHNRSLALRFDKSVVDSIMRATYAEAIGNA